MASRGNHHLRTRRALLLYKVYGDNALLALNWRNHILTHLGGIWIWSKASMFWGLVKAKNLIFRVKWSKLESLKYTITELLLALYVLTQAWRCLTKAVFIIFPTSRNTFRYPLSKRVANAVRNAFLELLRLSLNPIANTSREEGLVTAQLHCAVWPVEQRSCRAHA